ncbi:MAG: hypothetical protein R3249_02400 [Nitriliruptorales bacterium]|nr:hypothetical protein [Nitriliruptorales bacterium]
MTDSKSNEVREREVIVTDRAPEERSGLAGVLAAFLVIATVLFAVWLAVGSGWFDGDGEPAIPDDINVNIDDGGGSGDTGGDEAGS